uniref:Arf-GAP domain-containing protein n=1 Tax=Amphora coffeiformis TaxID=265554 RepID=A0A7S3L6D9_9STRA|mmetsp:Transcript_6466/g.12944  ORF Transcript_6466/g.12944 Transcript_6466/m.12944 type:complete len:209 (+) Transcript_6466:44-670(+)|eukprot:scaffold5479_cov199-Amphora_coffeaeformis.AAC.32
MWTSKLGHQYRLQDIEASEEQLKKELRELIKTGANSRCADCDKVGCNVWSSINLGIFLCMECGSRHRALGTHISKPKGCSGSYLWGPDEILQMKRIGNARSNAKYGGMAQRPRVDAPESIWMEYLRQKYEHKKFTTEDALCHESLDEKAEPPLLIDFAHFSDHHTTHGEINHHYQVQDNSESHHSDDVVVHVNKSGGGSTDFFAQFGV